MSWASERDQIVLVVSVEVDYTQHAVPRVVDVVKVSPQVAVLPNCGIIRLKKQKNHTCPIFIYP